jgi:hypothetical protein
MDNAVIDNEWTDGTIGKQSDVKEQLMNRAKTGEPMHNFSLSNGDYSHINLVKKASKTGYQLRNADCYHSDFNHAHCFKIDFSGSSLMKADFSNSNLHCANLTNCNLLGTNFYGAKLEHVIWGDTAVQEQQANKNKILEEKTDLYQQAEEVYRNLRLVSEKQGLFEIAGKFFQREMVMRRKQMPLWSMNRIISKIVDMFCGYGEQPIRVVAFTLSVLFSFTFMFFFSGLLYNGQTIAFDSQATIMHNLSELLSCAYFSIVTFTTLGYGDIIPTGFSRILASVEALFGSFTLALFVVVFVKKMTR